MLVRPMASSSRFGVREGFSGLNERAPHRDRFDEAHQRDAERRGPELEAERHVGQRERRQAGVNPADEIHPHPFESQQAGCGDGDDDSDERRREFRREMLESHDERQQGSGQCERHE